jgi:hypothetical protein
MCVVESEYLDSPNGLEQCEVVIFDELSDFESCSTLDKCLDWYNNGWTGDF